MKDLHISAKTIKLRRKHRKIFLTADLAKEFLDMAQKIIISTKSKLDIFMLQKKNQKSEKTIEWERIFVNQIPVSRIFNHLQLNNKKMNKEKKFNRHFSKEDIEMVNKHMKRC